MPPQSETLINLEKKFWQALVDQDADTATAMLTEPALMVSPHGAIKFDHAMYRRMAEEGPMIVTDYELGDIDVVFPNESTAVLTYHAKQTLQERGKRETLVQEVNDSSTWVKSGDGWLCAAHTESLANGKT